MKHCTLAILLILGTASYAQTSQLVKEISFLNLKGEFTKSNGIYTDSAGTIYGVRFVQQCNVFDIAVTGREVISHGSLIAEHLEKENIIRLFYSDHIRYVKFKKGNFLSFMEENTVNGNLKNWTELRYDKKRVNVFCSCDIDFGKLRRACN